MEISQLAQIMRITDDKVIRKAEELLRLTHVRAPGGIGVVRYIRNIVMLVRVIFVNLQSVLNLLLDCTCCINSLMENRCNFPIERAKLCKYSGNEKEYQVAHTSLQNLLGIKPKVSTRDLAIQFRSPKLAKIADRLLDCYKEKFLEGVAPQQRQFADFSRPVFPAVAFYLAGKQSKVNTHKCVY